MPNTLPSGPTKKGQGHLVAFRADRLGGRLISLLNTFRLAQSQNLPCLVHWRDADNLDDPCDIFAQDFVDQYFVDKPKFTKLREAAAPIASVISSPTPEIFAKNLQNNRNIIVDPAFDVLTLLFENADEAQAHFVKIAQALPLNPLLAERLAQAKQLFTSDIRTTAYHIRRGDLTADRRAMNKAWPNKFVPDEFFEAHMRANIGSTSRVILYSDNQEVLTRYKSMFPDLLTFNDIADSSGLNAPQGDALELLTMAMADQLIAPPSSAFSSTAKTIGGAAFHDVESQLDPQVRSDALDLLTHRLRDEPELFANEGEIGQYLVYAHTHLVAQDRRGEFAAIASDHIKGGLNIAFIHSLAARELYHDGQYQALCDLRDHIDRGFVAHSRSFAHLTFFHCLSLLMLNRKAEAIAQVSTAFWLEPTEGEINALVGIMESQGDLGRHNFWFSDPIVERVFANRFLLDFVKQYFHPLMENGSLNITKAVPNNRIKIWEWPYFAKSDVETQHRYKGHFRKLLKILHRHDWSGKNKPHFDSFIGLMALREGDMALAEKLILPAAKGHPDNALFHKRCADFYFTKRKWGQAIKAIDQAIALEPRTALFQAFKGLIQVHAKDRKGAAKTHTTVLDTGLQIPGLFFLAGEALEAAKQPQAAAKMVAKGLHLAPMDWKRQVALATLERDLGDTDAATKRMQWTLQWADERPPVVKTLTDLLTDAGDPQEALKILAYVRDRYPKKEQFAKLHGKLAKKLDRDAKKAVRKKSGKNKQ